MSSHFETPGVPDSASERAAGMTLPLATVSSAAAVLTACAGGGESSEASPAPGSDAAATSPPAVPPAPVVPPSRTDAARFLLQAQFSASEAEIAAVVATGYAAWLNQQFHAPRATSAWQWCMSKGYNAPDYRYNPYPVNHMAWYQLMASTDSVRMRFTLALSEIFVMSGEGAATADWPLFSVAAYWDTLATHAFGTYRQLLEAVTLSPAMGVFLNMRGNRKADPATGRVPDENFGREVMQLFSIGLVELNQDGSPRLGANGLPIETYDQDTVTAISRMFTGWDLDMAGATDSQPLQARNPMTLNPGLHADGGASFLGTTVPAGTGGVAAMRLALDTLANHPNVGPFIGKQLIQRLVTSNPSPAYVSRVVAAFNNNGAGVRGDMKAVLRAILLDEEARGAAGLGLSTWGKLREPMVRLVQWARTFKARSESGNWVTADASSPVWALGQSPLQSPSVFNFFRPGYVPPELPLPHAGYVAPEFQLVNESTVAAYINFMADTISAGYFDVRADYSTELALAHDSRLLVDHLNLLLAAGQLDASTLETIRSAVATISAADVQGRRTRVFSAILLVMASPQYLVQK